MGFDYVRSVTDVRPRPCTRAEFEEVVGSEEVARLCAHIARLTDREAIQQAKKRLPAFCFYATYGGQRRRAEHALPSGLAYLDLDHMAGDPAEAWRLRLAPAADRAGVMPLVALVHITPSRAGLRIVFRIPAGAAGIADAQRRMAAALGIGEYDAVVKDLARLSFAVPRPYVLHYVPEVLFAPGDAEASAAPQGPPQQQQEQVAAGGDAPEAPTPPAPAAPAGAEAPLASAPAPRPADYAGVPYAAIVRRRLEALVPGYEGTVPEGMRNATYFRLCCEMRYVTDFSVDWLLDVLPTMGLDAMERRRCAESAVRETRYQRLPRALSQAVADLQRELAPTPEAADRALTDAPIRSFDGRALPRFWRLVCKPFPADFHPAVVLASLPMLGTLATQVRTRYIDGEQQSLSFMTCIVAAQASGKSFVRRLSNLLLAPIRERDAAEFQKEQEYFARRRQAKNRQQQPQDPRARVRLLLPTISNAMLFKRLDCAEGQHCYFEAEELDTVAKAEGAGAWSSKSDLYRLAFDNAEGGQQYMSDASWSFKGRIYLNWAACATPMALRRFFKTSEDGLVSRIAFCTLGDQSGKPLVRRTELTDAERHYVEERCRCLDRLGVATTEVATTVPAKDAAGRFTGGRETLAEVAEAYTPHLVETPRLDEAIAQWLEDARLEYLADRSNHALDIFRRRAAVIGHRAGALASLTCDDAERRHGLDVDFALMVADTVLEMQLHLFGKQLNEVVETSLSDLATGLKGRNGGVQRRERNRRLYDALPAAFAAADIRAAAQRLGQPAPADARQVAVRWVAQGVAVSLGRNRWQKKICS